SGQDTLPNRQCEMPEVRVVPTSARCTLAEATAGEKPLVSRTVLVVTPKAMPRAPSTSCPNSPAKAKTSSRRTCTSSGGVGTDLVHHSHLSGGQYRCCGGRARPPGGAR